MWWLWKQSSSIGFYVFIYFIEVDINGYTEGSDGKYYKFYNIKKEWIEANDICQLHGGYLASEDGEVTRNYIVATYGKKGVYWMGLNDRAKEKNWVWVSTNRNAEPQHWAKNEPNDLRGKEHCGCTNWRSAGGWNDLPCTQKRPFLCQKGKNYFLTDI